MLTRAQYLSGDQSQGTVLPGQVQGIKGSSSILIGSDGTATINWAGSLGLGLALDGSFVKLSPPRLAFPPSTGAGQLQAINGSLYWDDGLTTLFIKYENGGNPTWVQISPGNINTVGGDITGVFGINGIVGGGAIGDVTLSISISSLPYLP